jgi:hypothetical protein
MPFIDNMRHIPNETLAEGTYRVVCLNCKKVYEEGVGNFSIAAKVSMKYSDKCTACLGEVILETNPAPHQNKYGTNHPYPSHL